ncbi:MAG: hypothetical protein ACI9X0_000264 [Kiritimatiellia bacterium]|jgi:uncharacterized protein (TIRG00374 family)
MKKHAAIIAQLAIGIGILSVIFARLHREDKLSELSEAVQTCATNWPYLVVGLISFAVCLFVCAWRWYILLKQQGIALPFTKVHALYYLGHFFNAFLLGATGGDVAKAYYVSKETQHSKAEAVATVLIDRLIGLLTLIALCAIVAMVRYEFFMQAPETRNALKFTALLFLGGIGLLVGTLGKPWLDKWPLFSRTMNATAVGRILDRMYAALHACIRKPSVAIATVALSLINHIAIIFGSYNIGLALGLTLTFWDQLIVFPLINMIAAVPITPSGIGTRDAAAVYLLAAFDVAEPHAIALSLLLYGTLMFWSLVGGVVYAVYAAKAGKVQAAD